MVESNLFQTVKNWVITFVNNIRKMFNSEKNVNTIEQTMETEYESLIKEAINNIEGRNRVETQM